MNDEQSGGGAARAGTLMNSQPSEGRETVLGGEIQAKIGQHLRAMYDDVVRQGVPDRFMDLLAKLDAAGSTKPGSDGDK
ncbi:hypothetical protein G3A50_12555 [Ancylobacter pratisalsi]|uniref:Anti-sigma factor NepR domain-containing protein n=2 Tax=Ancylobacter pratisalsi TaxID=1745854 RepID=A0A6P1YT78_9HYPH|nr:hypothetical protein G3A50_12555 [Ancylobacter pratisalsi]